jgi:chromosome segregation ATPase
LEQALSTVDSQVSQISEYGQRTIEAEKELKELRPRIKQAKLANERLSNTVGGLEREKREREEKGGGIDERAEQGCEWSVNHSSPSD